MLNHHQLLSRCCTRLVALMLLGLGANELYEIEAGGTREKLILGGVAAGGGIRAASVVEPVPVDARSGAVHSCWHCRGVSCLLFLLILISLAFKRPTVMDELLCSATEADW